MHNFDEDRSVVMSRMKENSVATIVVGVDAKTSISAVELAEKEKNIYACVGLHPTDNTKEDFDMDFYKELLAHERVVAVGECGLDYFHSDGSADDKGRQMELFEKHIELAVNANKSMMIHCRPSKNTFDAYEDILEILEDKKKKFGDRLRGNVHFFVGNMAIAEKFFELDFAVSFTGVITFTSDYDEVVKNAPLDKILSETDAPFVAPEPFRGKRNEPVHVKHVIERIAELRGEDVEFIGAQLVKNAQARFGV